jgi:hypothetical protein
MTVGDLLDALEQDYEIRGKRTPQVCSHLKPIRSAFGDWRAIDVTEQVIDDYIRDRRNASKADATVNRETQLLSQAYQLGCKKVGETPEIRKLEEKNVREGFFERADFEALVKELPEDIQDFARFGYLTGWRKGEIRNHPRAEKLKQELTHMRPLPARRLDAFREQMVNVTRTSMVHILNNTYSVPSRLIRCRLTARIYSDRIDLEYRGQVIERLERIRGQDKEKIDYRHVLPSLVRKPGAFRRFAYREALFPSLIFRRAYDLLVERSTKWADLEYLRILHLAATTLQCRVEQTLEKLLAQDALPDYETVKSLAAPGEMILWPQIRIEEPDLAAYDQLLNAGGPA